MMIKDHLNSFLYIADRPIQIKKTGPLQDLTIAIKDVIVTKDMPTTAGSKILEGFRSPYDATVVTKLKKAGARLVGKTNCDEFAMGSSGENSAYGPTKNPWDTSRVPGGSSSGSAATVAAGYVDAALGSDTGGSIRQPAAFCGVVGLKPTYGAVSRYGLIAMASSLDVIGPFGRDVELVERVFNVIKGRDPLDATSSDGWKSVKGKQKMATKTESRKQFSNFRYPNQFPISDNHFPKFRIGIPKEYFIEGMEQGVKEVIDRAIDKLENLGHKIIKISLPHTQYALAVYYIVQPVEVSANLARYDGIRYGKTRDHFGPEPMRRIMLGTFTSSSGYVDQYYNKALQVRALIKQDFDRAFQKVDVIAAPTTPTTAFKLGEKSADPLKMYLSDIFTVPANLAGIPGLSLPVGLSNGLPVGMQILGPQFGEELLFEVGKQLEEAIGFKGLQRVTKDD